MLYDKLFEEFVDEVKKEGTYASSEEIAEAAREMLNIVKQYPDSTPEELIEKVIVSNVEELERIKSNYPTPGYTVGVNVYNINVKIFGGNIDAFGRKMPSDALFDIASVTKFYTQIVAYNLIKEGLFSFDSKIKDLDNRFLNIGDLTVGDVLKFAVQFKTPTHISNNDTVEKALSCLYNTEVTGIGQYNYNDIGMILMKEVMESVTGISYEALVDKYIIRPLGLKNTYLVVPSEKIIKVTGTPNAEYGMVNDPSALALGGYSGHAGIKSTSDDLIRLSRGFMSGEVLPSNLVQDAYNPGVRDSRGIMGNTYVSHPQGMEVTFVDKLETTSSFNVQGSTRTNVNIGPNYASTILFNPSSMSLEEAKMQEAKINENRALKGQTPLNLVKHFRFDREGKIFEYNLIDSRQMMPIDYTLEPVTKSNAILVLRLKFLNKLINEYDKNYKEEIIVSKSV